MNPDGCVLVLPPAAINDERQIAFIALEGPKKTARLPLVRSSLPQKRPGRSRPPLNSTKRTGSADNPGHHAIPESTNANTPRNRRRVDRKSSSVLRCRMRNKGVGKWVPKYSSC